MYKRIRNAKIIHNVQKNCNRKQWTCMFPGCDKTAINSHYLQQRGILNTISISHNYVMFQRKNIMNDNDTERSIIVPTNKGIHHVLTQPIFCTEHDTSLFQKIEQREIDFSDKESLLLLCYRTICGELRKVEKCLFELLSIYSYPEIEILDQEYSNRLIAICNYYQRIKLRIEEDLLFFQNGNNTEISTKYIFVHLSLPKLEIFGSGIAGGSIITNNMQKNYSYYFIHIIPQRDSLHLLFIYDIDNISTADLLDILGWETKSIKDLGCQLTYLLSHKIEGFGMSKELFNLIAPESIEKFCSIIAKSGLGIINNEEFTFDLFKGIL